MALFKNTPGTTVTEQCGTLFSCSCRSCDVHEMHQMMKTCKKYQLKEGQVWPERMVYHAKHIILLPEGLSIKNENQNLFDVRDALEPQQRWILYAQCLELSDTELDEDEEHELEVDMGSESEDDEDDEQGSEEDDEQGAAVPSKRDLDNEEQGDAHASKKSKS